MARPSGVFADIPDHSSRYPVLPIPLALTRHGDVGSVGRGYWMDNDRLLFSLIVYAGPKPPKSQGVIIEWNTRTGALTRRGDGNLLCLSLDGRVVIDPNTLESRRDNQVQPYLHGPLGGPYETAPAYTPEGESGPTPYFYNAFSCRVYPRSGERRHPVPSIITPLLEGHGWLIYASDGASGRRHGHSELIFVRPDEIEAFRQRFSNGEREFSASGARYGVRYLPWLKKYHIPNHRYSGKAPHQAYLFDPATERLDTWEWPMERAGAGELHPARRGLLSLVITFATGPHDRMALQVAGVYLLNRDGSVVKVHQWETDYFERLRQQGQVLEVSPNGCRVLVNAGVFDICKGGE